MRARCSFRRPPSSISGWQSEKFPHVIQNAAIWINGSTLSSPTSATEVEELLFRGHPEVVDADLADYFGSIPHAELLKSVARRITGRVGDWRAGLGRSSCSLLARSFVCECHTISTMPRFQPPPRRTQHADFLALRSPACFAPRLMGPILPPVDAQVAASRSNNAPSPSSFPRRVAGCDGAASWPWPTDAKREPLRTWAKVLCSVSRELTAARRPSPIRRLVRPRVVE